MFKLVSVHEFLMRKHHQNLWTHIKTIMVFLHVFFANFLKNAHISHYFWTFVYCTCPVFQAAIGLHSLYTVQKITQLAHHNEFCQSCHYGVMHPKHGSIFSSCQSQALEAGCSKELYTWALLSKSLTQRAKKWANVTDSKENQAGGSLWRQGPNNKPTLTHRKCVKKTFALLWKTASVFSICS